MYTVMMTTAENAEPIEHQKIYDFVYDGSGERLDVYLPRIQGYTRNFFQRLLGRGDITVNDGLVKKKSYMLKPGDHVHIEHPERYMESSMLAQAPAVPEVEILLEKADYVVIHKPGGVLSHPNSVRGVEYPSVVGALYNRFKDMPSIGNFIRAGLIHRLDRETDGLMIIVKTERGLKHFQKLFHDKSKAETLEEKLAIPLHKRYRATSYILPEGQKFIDTVELPHYISMIVVPKIPFYEPKLGITKIHTIKKNEGKNFGIKTREGVSDESKKRHAVDYKELEKYDTVTLEMEILTGRTHQIRYHLSQHGLPIVGDYVYGGDDHYQMQLQAFQLEFEDPDGEMQKVSLAPLNS